MKIQIQCFAQLAQAAGTPESTLDLPQDATAQDALRAFAQDTTRAARTLLFNEDGTPSERALSIFGHTAMGRFGDPTELAGAAVYLASEKAASFVTGSDIVVDGGFLSQTI